MAEVIQADFPWYIELRDLIGNRPNSNPVSLGNSQTEVDLSVLATGRRSLAPDQLEDEDEPVVSGVINLDEPDGDGSQLITDDTSRHSRSISLFDEDEAQYAPSPPPEGLEDDTTLEVGQKKRKSAPTSGDDDVPVTVTTPAKGKKSTKSGATTPAGTTELSAKQTSASAKKVKGTKKLKYTEEFAEISLAEERTRQRHLELKQIEAKLELKKLEAKTSVKTETLRRQAEYEKLKLQATTQIRLAKLKYAHMQQTTAHVTPPLAPSRSPFPQAGPSSRSATPSAFNGDSWDFGRRNSITIVPRI